MKYEINGKIYVQEPLTVGQVNKLALIIRDYIIEEISLKNIILAIAENLPQILAILLKEEGTDLDNKDEEKLEKVFASHVDIELLKKIISDFFECNNFGDVTVFVSNVIVKLVDQMKKAKNGNVADVE